MAKSRALARRACVKPIVLGSFTLHETGVDIRGRPTFDQYAGVGDFITFASNASPWWRGDWLRYGESREDWKERLSQLHDASGMSFQTLRNERAVAKSIPPSRRRDGLEFGIHAAVAGMPPDEQTRMLDKAEKGQWTVRDTRHAVKKAKRASVIEGRAETMHTVEVTVQIEMEASTTGMAEQMAWDDVKHALMAHGIEKRAKVIAAHVRPR